jgi:pimeloyl-ACP methyl ester carboxylesterase
VVLAAHSYGGILITNAAVGHPNVKALVYVAAFAPAKGESLISLQSKPRRPDVTTAEAVGVSRHSVSNFTPTTTGGQASIVIIGRGSRRLSRARTSRSSTAA